jgi:hypothetical protein
VPVVVAALDCFGELDREDKPMKCILILLLSVPAVIGQTGTASITGTVLDAKTQKPVPAATFANCLAQTVGPSLNKSVGPVEEALATLIEQIESRKVQSVEVVYIPRYVITDARITPERIRHDYSYKINIQRFRASGEAALLLTALKKTTLRAYSEPADLRWGAAFNLEDGTVREVYMDGFGRFGQIDNLKVSFQGELYRWFLQLTRCFK